MQFRATIYEIEVKRLAKYVGQIAIKDMRPVTSDQVSEQQWYQAISWWTMGRDLGRF